MKGKEIIDQITKDRMPDIQQVLETCLNQPNHGRRGFSRLRLSTAVAIVAAFLVFATAAYAVAEIAYRRIETGSAMDLIVLPDDEYGRQLFHERTADWIMGRRIYSAFSDYAHVSCISERAARFVNRHLEGQIFVADGTAINFGLAVSMPEPFSLGYRLDDRGNALYTADGYQIGKIILLTNNTGEYVDVIIRTVAEEEAALGYNATLEEIVSALGRDIWLPQVHIEVFRPPVFNLTRQHDPDWSVRARFSTREIDSLHERWYDELNIAIVSARGEHSPLLSIYILGGEVSTYDIAGVTVYKLILNEVFTQFFWAYDGLAYQLIPSSLHTLAQTLEVIRSMVE